MLRPLVARRTFGQNLKRIREREGITQEELMRRLHLKRPTPISLWETGSILPRAQTIVRIADALKAQPREFLEDVETEYDRLRAGLPLLPEEQSPQRHRKRTKPAAVGRRRRPAS